MAAPTPLPPTARLSFAERASSATHPLTAYLLRLMTVTESERWSVLGSVDEVRETLETVIDSGDSVARSAAVGVLNLLGARGMSEFRDLVPLAADG